MTRKKKKIAILGCGWLGESIKKSLQDLGDEVNCLSRDVSMDTLVGFYACDVLIIAIPTSDESLSSIEDAYFSTTLNEELMTQFIFISSLSFFDNKKMIVKAEELVKFKSEDTVILRLGGLMGYDRIAGKYTAGKTVEDAETNYVHRDDVVGIVEKIIDKNVKNKIFNVVAPIQSTKKEIYAQNAKEFGFGETKFSKNKATKKSFSSEVLCETLEYSFKKENVKDFWK